VADQPHRHDSSCYSDVLDCVQTAHQHANACYTGSGRDRVLTCPTAEHRHALGCYKQRLTCRR
jgi:hypothetical protein